MQSLLERRARPHTDSRKTFPPSRKKKQFFTLSRRMSRPGNEKNMKTNADDKDLQAQDRNEAPKHELKTRPGRMKEFAVTEIENIKKSLIDLQHEEFDSPKYLKALDYIW